MIIFLLLSCYDTILILNISPEPQPVIRLYAVPITSFTADDDEDGEGFEEEVV
jgi:hypothetical protein